MIFFLKINKNKLKNIKNKRLDKIDQIIEI
jgi:regulator of PEP synthase PpsR (kinase-PPPase family)